MTQSVSIILPTHNRAGLLPRAVKSVLAQTHNLWELVVVVDGCTDSTNEALSPFLSDSRISVVELQQSVGGAEARNLGLERAGNEYIAFLDDDDEWLPTKLADQLSIFAHHPDVALVSCNNEMIGGSTSVLIKRPEQIFLDDLLYSNACGSFSFCMVKKECLGSLRLDRRLKACQDWDLWIQIVKSSGLPCRTHPGYLVRYYEHADGRLSTNRKNYYLSYSLFLRKYFPLMNQRQKSYNLAYLTLSRYLGTQLPLADALRLSVKLVRFGILSRRVSALGFLSFLVLPLLGRFHHGGILASKLRYVMLRQFRTSA